VVFNVVFLDLVETVENDADLSDEETDAGRLERDDACAVENVVRWIDWECLRVENERVGVKCDNEGVDAVVEVIMEVVEVDEVVIGAVVEIGAIETLIKDLVAVEPNEVEVKTLEVSWDC